jgi:hypothetical protein
VKQHERLVVSGLFGLLLLFWLGFLFHRSDRFAGSLWGGVLGVSSAVLMLWPLGYSLVKRVPALKAAMTKRVGMSRLLLWHVYTGIVGALLAVIHTGHKFNSLLGIALTVVMFAAVLSGYIGRHFLSLLSHELQERKTILTQLQISYQQTVDELAQHPDPTMTAASQNLFKRLALAFSTLEPGTAQDKLALSQRAVRLAESIADLEYAIGSDDLLKRRLAGWLVIHIWVSVIFYVLLALHIWSGVYFGLRWFA